MTDRPIPFSGPMVLAILAGTKTQTRRLIRPRKHASLIAGGWTDDYVLDPGNAAWLAQEVPYAVGDRLWVREAWRTELLYDDRQPSGIPPGTHIWYEASQPLVEDDIRGRLRPGKFMPRWASRLTLTVTDVRVQRLQEISEEDARAEGVLWVPGHGEITREDLLCDPGYSNFLDCRQGYEVLWDSLNAHRAPWESDPWIVAISFSVRLGNIDAPAALRARAGERDDG
jgi:hypothetical protein